jgi:hypothetical protein
MFISCSSWDKSVEAARHVYLLFFLGVEASRYVYPRKNKR